MRVKIVGMRHHKFTPVESLDDILLMKEKKNPFDKYAIAAYTANGEKMGYVSTKKGQNIELHKILDTNICWGVILDVDDNYIRIEAIL